MHVIYFPGRENKKNRKREVRAQQCVFLLIKKHMAIAPNIHFLDMKLFAFTTYFKQILKKVN